MSADTVVLVIHGVTDNGALQFIIGGLLAAMWLAALRLAITGFGK